MTSELPPHETSAAGGESAAIFSAPSGAGAVREELFDVLFADEVSAWPERAARAGVRLGWPALVLAALALVAGGMGVGSYLQRTRSSSPSSLFSQLASARRGAFAGFAGLGSSAGATTGTVTDVAGHTLYVTTASGTLVKVLVGATATVDRTTASALGALQVGDSVVVRGTTANGSVHATSVTATAKGVSSLGGLVP